MNRRLAFFVATVLLMVGFGEATWAASTAAQGVELRISTSSGTSEMATALKVLIGLTVLSLAPAILICMTSFVRIVIVMSLLRHAIGTPETPPNIVVVSLSLFLTLFTMSPVFTRINAEAAQPFLSNKMPLDAAIANASVPLREFMVKQTREEDMALMLEVARADEPKTVEDVSFVHLVPAFMLSELRIAFQVAFAVFLPFLLIDLIVASALMSLGMMMMPPTTVALPLKILMFVLVDGWNLVVKALLGTFV